MATIPLQIAERRLDPGNVVQYPGGGEVGRAMQDAGSEFTAVADRIQQRQDEMDRFKRITIENAMDADTANQVAEAARNGAADGSGLHDTIVGQIDPATGKVAKPGLFDNIADQYRAQVPPSQRGYFDASLPARRLQLSGSAATAQYEQEQKYATLETTKIQDRLLASILQMDPNDSASYEAYKEDGRKAILASPLSPLAKKATLDGWDQATPKALAQAISAKDPGQLRRLFGMAPPAGTKGVSSTIVATDVIPPEGAALLNTIAGTESAGAYDVINGGEKFSSFADHPKAGQRGSSGIAAGRYQDLPSTWERIKSATGVPDFSARSQDIGNWWLAQNDYKAQTGRDLLTDLKSPDMNVKAGIRRALSSTWKGLNKLGDGDFANQVSGGAGAPSAPKHTGPDLPIVFGDTTGRVSAVPDMKGVHPEVIDRFKSLQNSLGFSLPVVSGFRDAERNERAGGAKASQHIGGNALDLDVRGKSQAERIQIIQEARAQGFGGIGVYGNSIHIDTGPQRAWGASHHSDSLPMWARHALDNAPVGQAVVRTANAPMDPRFKGMSPDDMLALANQDDVAFRQKQAADVAQAKVEYGAYKDHIELGIRTGEIRDPALILNSKLNEGDQATLYEMLKSENKDNAGVDAIISAIGSNQKAPINSFDSDQSKIGDKAYNQFVAAVPPEKRTAAAATYVQATGYIPDPLQANLRQGAAAKTAPDLSSALSQADTVERIAPISFSNIPGTDVQTKLTDYRHFVNDLGMTGEEAAQEILRRADPANKATREVLKPQAEKFLKGLTVGDVTDAFDTFTGPGGEPGAGVMPQQPSELLAEYKELATDAFYDTGGDAGTAKARAIASIKKTWAVSNISGSPNLMRMAPELYYPPVGDNLDYLRADAMKTAQAYADEHTPGRKVENIAIKMSPDWTRRDVEMMRADKTRFPRYKLYYQFDDHGQSTWEEAYGVPWGVDAATIAKAREQNVALPMEKEFAATAVDGGILRAAQDKVRDIVADPYASDLTKALQAETATAGAQFQVNVNKDQRKRAAEPEPTPEEQQARDRGTRSYDGSQKTGFGNN